MLRPFFPYFGSKWRSAGRYPPPIYPTLIEPFAGSAGYALRWPDRRVVLVERNAAIAGIWRYLLRVAASEIEAIPAVVEHTDDVHLCQEARDLVGMWLQRGRPEPARTPSSWMRTGAYPESFWGPSIRARLAAQIERIRHWRLIEGDYSEAPSAAASWFIDPPYERQGHRYRADALDYARLAEWCRGREGQVIVCENSGATWLPFVDAFEQRSMRNGGRERVSIEAVCFLGRRAAP